MVSPSLWFFLRLSLNSSLSRSSPGNPDAQGGSSPPGPQVRLAPVVLQLPCSPAPLGPPVRAVSCRTLPEGAAPPPTSMAPSLPRLGPVEPDTQDPAPTPAVFVANRRHGRPSFFHAGLLPCLLPSAVPSAPPRLLRPGDEGRALSRSCALSTTSRHVAPPRQAPPPKMCRLLPQSLASPLICPARRSSAPSRCAPGSSALKTSESCPR